MTLHLPINTLYAFLLVLARVGGFIALLPVPGFRNAPGTFRVVLTVVLAWALSPAWLAAPNATYSIGQLTVWAFSEAGFGLAAGLAVAFLAEGLQVGAQVAGFQAGYGFASSIDPNSKADSSALHTMASLFGGLLFFTLGLDHQVIRVLAASFENIPAGSLAPDAASLDGVVRLGGEMLWTGLRLALPVVAILILIDLALAVLGRAQQQLQILSLAFPVKMAAALAILAALAPVVPRVFGAAAERTLAMLWRSLGP